MKKTIFIALLAVVILITAVCLTACRDDRNTGGIYIPPKDDLPSPDDYEKYPEGQPDDGKQDDTGEDLPEIVIDDGIVCGGIEFVIYSTASREIFAEARAIRDDSLVELTVPSEIEYEGKVYPVKRVGEMRGSLIEKLIISEGIEELWQSSFAQSEYLREIYLPDSLTAVPDRAFSGCTQLESVRFGNNLLSIGDGAFSDCDTLQTVRFPQSLKSIGYDAFSYCDSIAEVEIAGKITSADAAFSDCKSLSKITATSDLRFNSVFNSSTTRNAVREITVLRGESPSVGGLWLFEKLEKVRFDEGIESVEPNAFVGCSSLVDVDLPSTLASIGYNAFADCVSLASIDIPASVSVIANAAFSGCTALTQLTLNEGLKRIESNAFVGTAISEVVMPSTIETLGFNLFGGDGSLRSVTLNFYGFDADAGFALSHILGSDSQSTLKKLVVRNAGESRAVPEDYCKGFSALEEVVLAADTEIVGNSAFYDCRSLISVTLPDGLKELRGAAFYGCNALEEIVVPDSVDTFAKTALGLKTVVKTSATVLPQGWGDVENTVILDCNGRAESVDGYSVADVGGIRYLVKDGKARVQRMKNTNAERDLVLPDNIFWNNANYVVEEIMPYAFYEEYLTSVVLSDSILTVGEGAFSECKNLSIVTLGADVQTLGTGVFADCTSLARIDLPDGLVSIGASAFAGCSALTNLTLPASVGYVGRDFIGGCSSIESVTFESPDGWYYGEHVSVDLSDEKYNVTFLTENPVTLIKE